MSVFDEISAERRRQINDKGWDQEHDDAHTDGELIWCPWGALSRLGQMASRKMLIEAAALIVAEVERLDRAKAREDGLSGVESAT